MNAQPKVDPLLALPPVLDDWKIKPEEKQYNDQNLFDYIDGAAELYISFGFSKVCSRIYSNESGKEIILDIFYMNSCYDAYGVFSYSVGKIEKEFGNQSQRTTGSLVFWKDHFYVSIMSNPETEESKKIILKLGRIIESAIPNNGEFPKIISMLPDELLNKESVRYFRHYIWLNSHIFISSENILNINQNTECVQAKYGEKDKSILMIVNYPDMQSLAEAEKKFIEKFNPLLKKQNLIKTNDKWFGIDKRCNSLILVFNAAKKSSVVKLLDLTKEKINSTTTKN